MGPFYCFGPGAILTSTVIEDVFTAEPRRSQRDAEPGLCFKGGMDYEFQREHTQLARHRFSDGWVSRVVSGALAEDGRSDHSTQFSTRASKTTREGVCAPQKFRLRMKRILTDAEPGSCLEGGWITIDFEMRKAGNGLRSDVVRRKLFRTGDRMSPRRTRTGSPSHDLMGKDFG